MSDTKNLKDCLVQKSNETVQDKDYGDELINLETSHTNPQHLKLSAENHEKHGHSDKALLCYLQELEILLSSNELDEDDRDINIAQSRDNILRVGMLTIHLPDNVYKQDLLTQLYMLGCSLHRDGQLQLAIRVLQVAVNVYSAELPGKSESLNTDEIMLMKILFELGCCKEEIGQLEECIENYRSSIAVSFHHKDISFEKMVSLRLCNVLMEKQMYGEAAIGYLRILAIGSDIQKMLDDDMLKYRAHWTVECESEIRYNLCVAFKSLHLYKRALKEGINFKRLVQDLGSVKSSKPRAIGVYCPTHTMQANFLVGRLYELLGDYKSSLSTYQEWLTEIYGLTILTETPDLTMQLELASAYQCVGGVMLEVQDYDGALSCFTKLTKIGQDIQDPQLEVNGLLLQGDVILARNHVKKARDVYAQALKITQTVLDDYSIECRCIAKEAETYAKELRYTHALYHCERALHLGRKCEDQSRSIVSGVERQAALYSQHSTSEKELSTALNFLAYEIRTQEENIHLLLSGGVCELMNVERILEENYKAIQVILHRLGENRLSLAFAECQQRRKILQARNMLPEMPQIEYKGLPKLQDDLHTNDAVSVVKVDHIISPASHCTVISYSLCDSGFLVHVMEKGLKVTYSYLMSDHMVSPGLVVERLTKLLRNIQGMHKEDVSAKLATIYNTESRVLPDFSKVTTQNLRVPTLKETTSRDGAGDSQEHHQAEKQNEKIEFSKNLASKGLLLCEGAHPVKLVEEPKKVVSSNVADPLRQLYGILIQPLSGVLNQLPSQSSICIVTDGFLSKVPFDQLVNPATGKPFGETFNVTTVPCLLVLDNWHSAQDTINAEMQIGHAKDSSNVFNTRKEELAKTYRSEDLHSLEKIGYDKAIMGLVSSSATGTNVITSPRYATPYHQVEFELHACVIGSPTMSYSLQIDDNVWKPRGPLLVAQQECKKVAEYLDTFPIIGENASKSEFLSQMSKSTLIHIATFGSMKRGTLAFRPDIFPTENEPVSMERYVVSLQELIECRPNKLKLAVLSSGHDWHATSDLSELKLPNVLLAAGVQCVVYPLWPIPDSVSHSFFYHFYHNLQTSCNVSRAVYQAKIATKARHPNPEFWNAFVATGSDVTIDLSEIRGAEMHRSISRAESNQLSAPLLVETGDSQEESFHKLQESLSWLSGCLDVSRDSDVVSFLLGLLEEATDRLTRDENADKPMVVLPEAVKEIKGSTDLLTLLGFDFQAVNIASLPLPTRRSLNIKADRDVQMIVFPHWNQDSLLLPAHQALTGLHDLCANSECLRALALMLPLSQELLCGLIDLLAVIHHTPEVQLRITDAGARHLWGLRRIRDFLRSVGVRDVRDLLSFYRVLENRSLLVGAIQLLTSVCLHRDHRILEQLNVATLGKSPERTEEKSNQLKSVDAIVMPRNEILVRSSWMADRSYVEEKDARKKLATDLADLTDKFARALDHAKWWHQDVKIPQQAVNSLASTVSGLAASDVDVKGQLKVKVKSGATPSCNRVLIDAVETPSTNLHEVLKRREEARYVLHRRCVDLDRRHASALRASYLPYTTS